jgi:hypothetical protein
MILQFAQLHHATIITGNRIKNLEMIKDFLVSHGIEIMTNPDLSIFEDDQMLMADAESLIKSVSSKGLSGKRFCIISTDRIATDVQNTLLKTLEEPYPGTHFFIVLPNIDRVLPTVLSRCQVVAGDNSLGGSRLDAQEFLKQSMADRFLYVESWTKNKKDEDNVSKTEILNFIDTLEKFLWESGNRDEQLFTDLRQMKSYANIRGASHRVILDFIGIVCPVFK